MILDFPPKHGLDFGLRPFSYYFSFPFDIFLSFLCLWFFTLSFYYRLPVDSWQSVDFCYEYTNYRLNGLQLLSSGTKLCKKCIAGAGNSILSQMWITTTQLTWRPQIIFHIHMGVWDRILYYIHSNVQIFI